MLKNYKLKESLPPEIEKELMHLDPLVRQLLYTRGITTKEKADSFLQVDWKLHDPLLLPDMEKAVERILSALDHNEKIYIWSDYDADGIPGGALLHDFLKLCSFTNFLNYIPDRHLEGYGLNMKGIDMVAASGATLLITIDCGIRDLEKVAYAKKLGIDTIITDHHEQGPELPESFAIVNHKIKSSLYPESVLCGSGIVWKLIEGMLIKRRSLVKDGQEKWLLDLAGIATLSDMVPLTGENRTIAHFGLQVLRKTKRPGLQKLYSMLKINKENLSEDDIGFLITPRINAASRMGKPRDAFDLLVASTPEEADEKARHLDKINNERKGVVASIVKEALKMLRAKIDREGEKSVIVLGNPDWRPSLLGLAANSLAEEYRRPVFLWGREDGEFIKGSCRSDGVTDLVALMERTKNSFSEFGGHAFSGGFAVDFDNVHSLEEKLLEAAIHTVSTETPEVLADAVLTVQQVNRETAEMINKLAPFGVGNPKPVFLLYNIIPEKITRFGKNKDHLSLTIRDGSHTTRAISFFTEPDKFGDKLKEGLVTNLVANIELSFFMNRPEVRLRVIDFF